MGLEIAYMFKKNEKKKKIFGHPVFNLFGRLDSAYRTSSDNFGKNQTPLQRLRCGGMAWLPFQKQTKKNDKRWRLENFKCSKFFEFVDC